MFRWILEEGTRYTFSLIHIPAFRSNQWLSCDGNECNPMYSRDNMITLRYRDYIAVILDIHCVLLAGIFVFFKVSVINATISPR